MLNFFILGFKITVEKDSDGYYSYNICKLIEREDSEYELLQSGVAKNPDQIRAKVHHTLLKQYDNGEYFTIHSCIMIYLGCESMKDKLDLIESKKSP